MPALAVSQMMLPVTRKPREPALAAIARATVRVADGSGVVVCNGSAVLIATAAHVVRGISTAMIVQGPTFGEGAVIARNEVLDVALVTAPRELEARALGLADCADDGCPGDPIWAAGFPRGWKGSDPVLSPGTIAGIGEENWVNLDGSWGSSGGPLCRLTPDGRCVVVGLLLGHAGDTNRRLEEFVRSARANSHQVDNWLAQAKAQPDDLDIGLLQSMKVLWLDIEGRIDLAELLEEHFRTGFLRFAPVTDIWTVLGPRNDSPAI